MQGGGGNPEQPGSQGTLPSSLIPLLFSPPIGFGVIVGFGLLCEPVPRCAERRVGAQEADLEREPGGRPPAVFLVGSLPGPDPRVCPRSVTASGLVCPMCMILALAPRCTVP